MATNIIPGPVLAPGYAGDPVYQDNISISGTTYLNGSVSVAKTGYTPLGVITLFFSNASSGGARYTYVDCVSFELSGTTVNYRLYNRNSNTAKVQLTIRVLYKIND